MSKGPFILDYVEGDLLPYVEVEWEGQDITGFTFELHLRKPNGLRITKSAIVDDLNAGGAGSAFFHFEWAPGDLVVGERALQRLKSPTHRAKTRPGRASS